MSIESIMEIEDPRQALQALRKTIAEEAPCIRDEALEIHKKLRGIMRNSAGRVSNMYAFMLIACEDAEELQRRVEFHAKKGAK